MRDVQRDLPVPATVLEGSNAREILRLWTTEAGERVTLPMLTDEERACFEWRPVRAGDRETKYLELIHRIPPTPRVAPLGATARHSRCEACRFIYVYVEQVANEPNQFVSTRDLPDPLPPHWPWGR